MQPKIYSPEKGYDHQYGARPLNRAIQKYLEDPIAEEILKGEIKDGDTIIADKAKDKDEIAITIQKQKDEEKSEKEKSK